MVYKITPENLFTYPKITGLVDLPTTGREEFLDQFTQTWLENVLIEFFSDGIKKILPHRIRPWSKVFSVETNKNGSFFLKTPAAEFCQEGLIQKLVIDRFHSNITIPVLTRNRENGAFLMPMLTGNSLRVIAREKFDETFVENIACRIGEFQKNIRECITDFGKLNIPKWTSEAIISECKVIIQKSRFLSHSSLSIKNLDYFRSLLPAIHQKLDLLVNLDKGLSLDHGDFQDNNIFISEDRILFMDWADASISIPSFTIGTYCHSLLLAHPNIENKTKLIQNILLKYYFELIGTEYQDFPKYHAMLIHVLYPIICILKVGRLLNLKQKSSDKYASTIIDYWISIIISFTNFYGDKPLCN